MSGNRNRINLPPQCGVQLTAFRFPKEEPLRLPGRPEHTCRHWHKEKCKLCPSCLLYLAQVWQWHPSDTLESRACGSQARDCRNSTVHSRLATVHRAQVVSACSPRSHHADICAHAVAGPRGM